MVPASDFDWVKARTECSPATVFQRLKIGIKADVEARSRSLLEAKAGYGFTAISEHGTMTVFLQGNSLRGSVVFEQTENGITVHDGNDKLLCEASLTLNDD